MSQEHTTNLSQLFGAALRTMEEKRQAINDLDGYNGNHGDHMVQNVRLIRDTVAAHEGEPPSEALRHASRELAAQGQGGTSPYYVRGLNQAADELEGHAEMRQGEVMTLVQNLLGAVPQQGHPQQMEAGGSVLDQMLGMAGDQMTSEAESSPLSALLGAQSGQTPGGSGSGSPLDALLGAQGGAGGLGDLLGGEQGGAGGLADLLSGAGGQGEAGGGLGDLLGTMMGGGQPGMTQGGEEGGGDLLQALLPAAMAFLQAKQSGSEMGPAVGQALLAVLGGGQVNPLQSGAPRPAAGGLIAQSLMQAFMNR